MKPIKNAGITAWGLVSPFGIGRDKLWNGLINQRIAIKEIEDFEISSDSPKLAARIPERVYQMDPFMGLGNPDHNRLLFLIGLAIEDLIRQNNISISDFKGPDVSLFISTLKGDIINLQNCYSQGRGQIVNRNSIFLSHTAKEVATALSIQGTVRTISSACASGTVALSLAADEIRFGNCDKALIIGADLNTSFVQSGFASLKALSHEPCRPFDRNRSGLSLGEGAAVILMKKDKTGDSPVLLGSGITNDTCHITRPAEHGEGLRRAIQISLSDSGVPPEKVGAIVAHGTGTKYSDRMEIMAFQSVFHEQLPLVCGIKGAVGHSLGASGVIESIFALEILKNKFIPPTSGLELSMHRYMDFNGGPIDSSNILNTNSGFGGINAAILIGIPDE